ncbi:hypothetical protein N0V88_001183 [Collariella sp. IMI 366227]|nr:hypothetical protein N0V88_001183 [Collariella sp. IMI 366227]
MVKYTLIAFAGLAAALPLNINLGAYSPALVVGRQDVSNLITALEGAAVNAAAGAAANRAAGEGTGAGTGAGAANAAAVVAAATSQPNAAPSADPVPVPDPATDPALIEQAKQIAGLQGMGKAIAPRVDGTEPEKLSRRDLAGFDRALTYAEAALTKGPKIQLGTGAEGSGVGIIVDNTPNAAAGEGEGAAAEKRNVDEATAPRRRAKVTTMFVRRGIPASLHSPSEEAFIAAAAVAARSTPQAAPSIPMHMSKRESTFDEVNLNVDGDAGVTMTFVESFDEDDDENDDE